MDLGILACNKNSFIPSNKSFFIMSQLALKNTMVNPSGPRLLSQVKIQITSFKSCIENGSSKLAIFSNDNSLKATSSCFG